MLLSHLGKAPNIHPTAWVAPSATVCGDVAIGAKGRIMHGAAVIAEDSEALELSACRIWVRPS